MQYHLIYIDEIGTENTTNICGNKGQPLAELVDLAEQTGISFTIMQMAFNTLIADGILTSGVSRQGTRVRKDWAERILPNSVLTFRPIEENLFRDRIHPQVPELFDIKAFHFGSCEIRVSSEAVAKQQEYLDLSEFFESEFPDRSGRSAVMRNCSGSADVRFRNRTGHGMIFFRSCVPCTANCRRSRYLRARKIRPAG